MKKKYIGQILALLFVSVIISLGYFLGKNFADEYNKKHQTKKSIFEIIKIEKMEIPMDYILNDGFKTLTDLCGKNTGICDQEVGYINLNNIDIRLHIYANFDNPEDLPTTYFKFNNKKIGSFVYLNKFEILDGQYFLVTEPNSHNDNFVIHLYDDTGKEVASYDATKLKSDYTIKNNDIYYHYCNVADTKVVNDEEVPKVSYFKVSAGAVTKKEEISFEYKKCA